MDDMRTSASAKFPFDTMLKGTADGPYLECIDLICSQTRASRSQRFIMETELDARNSVEPLTNLPAVDCLLVGIRRGIDETLDISPSRFRKLWHRFGLDDYALQLLHRSSFGVYHLATSSGTRDTFYLKTTMYTILWSFCSESNRIRGFIIPFHRVGVFAKGSSLQGLAMDVETQPGLLSHKMGLLFLCASHTLRWVDERLSTEVNIISKVEAGADHGAWFREPSVIDVNVMDVDKLTGWTREMGRSGQDLTECRRHCEFMDQAVRILEGMDTAGVAASEDQQAIRIIKTQLASAKSSTECLVQRARNQMSVLFNLLSREDTRSSIRLTDASLKVAEATRQDSNAMKTVAMMTMLFLPGTFFSALFSMPLLRWEHEEGAVMQKHFWIYWACTSVTTAGVFLVWALITYRDNWRRMVSSGPKTASENLGRSRGKSKPEDIEVARPP